MIERIDIKTKEDLFDFLEEDDGEIPDKNMRFAIEMIHEHIGKSEWENEHKFLSAVNKRFAEYVFSLFELIYITSENKLYVVSDNKEMLLIDNGDNSKSFWNYKNGH